MSVSRIDLTDANQIRRARRALQRILPKARARARERAANGDSIHSMSALGSVVEPHLRIENILGAFVYRTDAGWFADFALRTTPIGVPYIFGTLSSVPLPSEIAAETAAIEALSLVILAEQGRVEHRGPTVDANTRVFELGELSFTLPSHAVEAAGATAANVGWTLTHAKALVTQLIAEDFPRGLSEEAWGKLPVSRQERYLVQFCVLLAHGDFRFEFGPSPAGRPATFTEGRKSTTSG